MMRTDSRSMQMSVHVRSGEARGGREKLSTAIHATAAYLAMDRDWNPLPARQFIPHTEEDKRLAEHATTLRNLRSQYSPLPLVHAPNHQHID